jgi:hypothetical protein
VPRPVSIVQKYSEGITILIEISMQVFLKKDKHSKRRLRMRSLESQALKISV